MQTCLKTQRALSDLLEQARQEGEVRIQRENGQTFVLNRKACHVRRSMFQVLT